MSRKIVLLRHAQTAGKQAGQRDYERILTPEGEEQCRKTRQQFIRNSFLPNFILSSAALRAQHTARLVSEGFAIPDSNQQYLDTLYEADGDTWMRYLRQLPPHVNEVLCVGHNPILSWLASHLSGHPKDLAPCGFILLETTASSWMNFPTGIHEVFSLPHPHP